MHDVSPTEPTEPTDRAAELAVAATLLKDPSAWYAVSELLREEMFTVHEARRVFAALATVHRRLATVGSADSRQRILEELQRSGTLDAGWTELLEALPPEDLRDAAQRVSELWLQRLLSDLAHIEADVSSRSMAELLERLARRHDRPAAAGPLSPARLDPSAAAPARRGGR